MVNPLEHLVEFGPDPLFELRLHGVDIREFGKGPAPVTTAVVYARDPIGVHGLLLDLGILAAVALDLDDQVQ